MYFVRHIHGCSTDLQQITQECLHADHQTNLSMRASKRGSISLIHMKVEEKTHKTDFFSAIFCLKLNILFVAMEHRHSQRSLCLGFVKNRVKISLVRLKSTILHDQEFILMRPQCSHSG